MVHRIYRILTWQTRSDEAGHKWAKDTALYSGYGKTDGSPTSATGTVSGGPYTDISYSTYFYQCRKWKYTHDSTGTMFNAGGFDFDHWDSKSNDDEATYQWAPTLINAECYVVHAHWKFKSYTITYVTNSGTLDS